MEGMSIMDHQLDLFAHARETDPETSHHAAGSVSSHQAALIRTRVMSVLKDTPATDEAVIDAFASHGWPGSPSGIRTRRSELVEAGHVIDTGRHRKTRSGRDAIVWGIK